MIYRSVRRSASIVALVLLTLSLVLGTTSVSAKPGGSNSPNAKLCQKGGYTALTTTEDPTTAFATWESMCHLCGRRRDHQAVRARGNSVTHLLAKRGVTSRAAVTDYAHCHGFT